MCTGRRTAAPQHLTVEEARHIAVNIAQLPDLVRQRITGGYAGISGTSRSCSPCSAFPKRPSSVTTISRSQLCAVPLRRVSCQIA
jgi:hypothetical protein